MYNFAMYTGKTKFSVIGPGLKLSKILVINTRDLEASCTKLFPGPPSSAGIYANSSIRTVNVLHFSTFPVKSLHHQN